MEIIKRSFLTRYGAAVISTAAALALRSALTPVIEEDVPFITMFPAIVFSAMFGGFGAGLATTLLGALTINFFIMFPQNALALSHPRDIVQMSLFVATGVFISWLAGERKRAHSLLRLAQSESERSENRSQLAQKFTGVGIWEWDLKTGKVEWSEGIYELLGLETGAQEATLENWLDYMLPEDREPSMAKVRKAIDEGGDEFYHEFRVRRPDGAVRWIASQGQIIRGAGKGSAAERLFGVNYDITARKESELAIKNLNHNLNIRIKELQTIFDIAPVGIAVAGDANCDVISANPALARILGIEAGDNISVNPGNARNVPYKHLKDGRELEPHELPMQRAVSEKRTILDDETDILRADGNVVTIYSYAAPVFDEDGNVVSCIAAHVDVTERKKDERERERQLDLEQSLRLQAEESNRLKDEFLATVSHELRTPLNSIIGWITMLREGNLSGANRARALEAIERGAKSQSQLIEDLLDVSRIISGKLNLSVQPVNIIPVINAAVETVRPAAEAKGIELHAIIKPNIAMLSGDADRLQQIIWNLLSNAIKFTPKGGAVEIVLPEQSDAQHLEIIVRDNGRGISRDFLPFVFDRFRQADGSITRHFTGLGLGLAIVRHLVELHGGTVEVESEGEGKGATFTVRLPSMALPGRGEREKEIAADGEDGFHADYPLLNDLQILIIDDEDNTRELLQLVFENCRAVVETAASSAEALEKIKKLPPHLIVSDIGMPGEDGYTLIRKIRAWEKETGRGRQIPAIALTAYARAEDRRQALEAGYQVHTSKPIEPVELTRLAENLVRH
ncbi:MAG: ATP-binding protein [Acidobacteriota bacterium]|nr:ATP-binding protein [Acidobacteriota bacterium]